MSYTHSISLLDKLKFVIGGDKVHLLLEFIRNFVSVINNSQRKPIT